MPETSPELAAGVAAIPASQRHFVADDAEAPLLGVDVPDEAQQPSSLWRDAWHQLRRRVIFWVAAVLIVVIVAMALVPQLFTSQDPAQCELANSLDGARAGHPFGFTRQGCDVYARVIYGARASVTVGLLTTFGVVVLGGVIGAIAGYLGGWVDSILSRVADIFFAIPLVLAAIVVMQTFQDQRNAWTVAVVLVIFGWPQLARITRSAVIAVRNTEFVLAARALGAAPGAILRRHVVPNSLAPIIVTATVALGTYIVAEATLSFLGIGLPPTVVSWGLDISQARPSLRTDPLVLFYPAAALALTVLSFIMMGDVVRDALDPKARKR